ncbi:MAG: hypothetical protein ACP5Q1_12310, partial [Anaerolineae bacterium]
EQAWDTAVLVEAEGFRYYSSEGIYEGFVRSWRDLYVTGITDKPDLSDLASVRQRLRQEYAPWFNRQVTLYFSPIDNRLHLHGATVGYFNLDDVHLVGYADLDSDSYFDQWTFTVHPQAETPAEGEAKEVAAEEAVVETPLKSLQYSHGYLLYGDTERVKIRQSQVPRSLFEALPPRNHEEWLALGEQLERYGKDFAADDFLGMMEQFQGPTTEIIGAQIEDFRLTKDGFRFVLHLQPGFRVLGDENEWGAANLPAGSYLVRYQGVFQMQPLTQPYVTLPQGALSCDSPMPQQLQWTTIRAVFHNSGLRDCRSLPARLYAAHEGGAPLLLAEERVSVPGEGTYVWEQHWPPNQPGRWTIWVEVEGAEAVPGETQLGDMARLELEVAPAPMPQMFAPREAYDGVRFTLPVALLLGSAGLAAMAVLGLILSTSTKGEQDWMEKRCKREHVPHCHSKRSEESAQRYF